MQKKDWDLILGGWVFGDKEGNSPLRDQRKIGEGKFFWAATGEGLQSPSVLLFRPKKLHGSYRLHRRSWEPLRME